MTRIQDWSLFNRLQAFADALGPTRSEQECQKNTQIKLYFPFTREGTIGGLKTFQSSPV